MNHAITVEHYLPKSRYPVLALHPNNLIPACDKCNSIKGEKDPLEKRSFQSVVMPYREAVREIARLDFSETNGAIEVRFVPTNPDPHTPEKINVLSELFDVPGQWQNNIVEIGKIAIRRASDFFAGLREAGIQLTDAEIQNRMGKVYQRMERDWGIQHYHYPATKWLEWASGHNPQMLAEDIRALLDYAPTP